MICVPSTHESISWWKIYIYIIEKFTKPRYKPQTAYFNVMEYNPPRVKQETEVYVNTK
jgi:hypothetical protein